MLTLDVNLDGWNKLEETIKKSVIDKFPSILQKATKKVLVVKAKKKVRALVSDFSPRIPNPKRTGTLEKSIKSKIVSRKRAKPIIRFGTTGVSYAIFFSKGTGVKGPKKTYITPKPPKQYIHFTDGVGKWYHGKRSYGMPPRPFLMPTVHENKEGFKRVIKDEILKKIRTD